MCLSVQVFFNVRVNMTVKEMVQKLKGLNQNAEITIIQQETLECSPEWWDAGLGEYGGVSGKALEIYSEDLHSHMFYLLAVDK